GRLSRLLNRRERTIAKSAISSARANLDQA
ncbi:MAG: hypothetical protein ACI9BD_000256, partial [Candidatus Marinamargulisbacteria bacterium]